MPRIAIEQAEEVELLHESSTERFDRIAFAERAIALVRPPNTTVAICEGTRGVHVEAGRQWGAPAPDARWAIVRVPPDASRRAIAAAVLGLHRAGPGAGTDPYRSGRAWALDVLLVELGGLAPWLVRRPWGDAE